MGKITLSSGFKPLEEGRYVFQVEDIEYQEAFGKLKVMLITEEGKKHREQFSLLKGDGSPNDGALVAFSILAKNIIGDLNATEVDPDELKGKFVEADVTHDEYNGRTYAHIGNYSPSAGWGGVEASSAPTTGSLSDLLS